MSDQLLTAVQHYEAGNKEEAQKQLALALRSAPQNEQAWLLLALTLADAPERQQACLERVLQLNPQNSQAQQLLQQGTLINGRLSPDPTPLPTSTHKSQEETAVSPPETYAQVDELLATQPDPMAYNPPSTSTPHRSTLRKFLIIVGIILFASALYAASVLLLVNPNGVAQTTPNSAIVAATTTKTIPPTATSTTTAVPTSTPTQAAALILPTATSTTTAVPTSTSTPTSTIRAYAPDSLSYLATSRDTATPLQNALTQIIPLVAEVDFDNPDWHTAMQAQIDIITTTTPQITALEPTDQLQELHNTLLITSNNCHEAAAQLSQGIENRDIEAMQPASSYLANCRAGFETLSTAWSILPIDVNSANATPTPTATPIPSES